MNVTHAKKQYNKHPPLVSRKSQNIVTENAKRIYRAPGGLKYAIAWVAYVLLGSWLFLVLEETTTDHTIRHEQWIRFKDLYISGEGAEELENVKHYLSNLCPHRLFNNSFENSTFDSAQISHDIRSSAAEEDNVTNFQNLNMHNVFEDVERKCQNTLITLQQITTKPDWTMVDAIYYTMTLVTTIGFGHIYPTTDKGKIFCILYAVMGVPLTCILMARSSNWLSTKMVDLYQSAKKVLQINEKTVLWIVTWMFIAVGFIVFMLVPSILFSYVEEWSFVDAIYFTFITLTTIGFGDFIAGYGESTPFTMYYRILIVIWIMFALGYWVLCLTFLQKAIKQNAKHLKKTFRRKTIAKPTDAIKQLMSKLKNEPEETKQAAAQRVHMMALLVESIMRRNSFDNGQSYANLGNAGELKKKPSILRKPTDLDETIYEFEDEPKRVESTGSGIEVLFSLDDLLDSSLLLRKDKLPGIESIVSRVNCNSQPRSTSGSESEDSNSNNNHDTENISLTVREVMGLALLLSSISNGSETSEMDSPSEYSDSCTAVVVDPKENIPLLKDILSKETTQIGDVERGFSPKLEKCFFISQSSLCDVSEKVSHRQCEIATG